MNIEERRRRYEGADLLETRYGYVSPEWEAEQRRHGRITLCVIALLISLAFLATAVLADEEYSIPAYCLDESSAHRVLSYWESSGAREAQRYFQYQATCEVSLWGLPVASHEVLGSYYPEGELYLQLWDLVLQDGSHLYALVVVRNTS